MATTAKKRTTAPKTAKRATKTPAAKSAATAAKSAPKAAKAAMPAAPKPEAAAADPFAFAAEFTPANFMLGQQDATGVWAALSGAMVENTQTNIAATVAGFRELMSARDVTEAISVQTRLFTEGMARSTQQALALQTIAADAVKEAGTPFADFKLFELPRI